MKRIIVITTLFPLLLLTLGACGQQTPTTSHGGLVQDYVSLIDHLRAQGATVTPTGDISQPFFSVSGHAISVNGEQVQVYEYADVNTADAAAAQISSDGGAIGTTQVDWIAPPHFYEAGKIIVLYIGTSSATLQLLVAVLGAQFAGR